MQWKERGDVKYDLFANGFKPDYTHWIHHGEPSLDGQNPDSDQVDVGSSKNTVVDAANPEFDSGIKGDFDNGINEVKPNDQLLKDVEVPLYDGHKNHTILSAVTKLLHFKREHNCSEKDFDDLVKLIKEFLPANDKLPRTYCDVKQLVEKLNLGNEYMNACDNDEAKNAVGGSSSRGRIELNEATFQSLVDVASERILAETPATIYTQGPYRDHLYSTVQQEVHKMIGTSDSRPCEELLGFISSLTHEILVNCFNLGNAAVGPGSCSSQVTIIYTRLVLVSILSFQGLKVTSALFNKSI